MTSKTKKGFTGIEHVVVDAVTESACPKCGLSKEWDLYLHIERDRLTRLQDAKGEYDFVHAQENFIILKP